MDEKMNKPNNTETDSQERRWTPEADAEFVRQEQQKREARTEEAGSSQQQTPLTPGTDDPTAVLAPDDTFPGSGPNH